MRVGWRVPLPGPFTVSGRIGGRRRRGGAGCLPLFAVLVLIGLVAEHPWLWIAAGVLTVAAVALVVIRRR